MLEIGWYFVIYAFLGWCLEVVFHVVQTGKFVNRGFLNGPVCPIYGFGVVLVVLCLTPLNHSLLLLFIGSVILTSLLEFAAGFILEKAFHTKWWDYSDQPFHIKGYICLKFSLSWGVASVFVMRLVHPMIEKLVGWVPHFISIPLLCLVLALFLADAVATVVAVRQMDKRLRLIHEIGRKLRSQSDAIGKNITADTRRLLQAKEKLDAQSKAMERRLLKAFPNLQSKRYEQELEALRERLYRRIGERKEARRRRRAARRH